MDKFAEYEFDVTRLWAPQTEDKALPPRSPRRSHAPRPASAKVLVFPKKATPAPAREDCRARTLEDLRATAVSLKLRDRLLRNGLADRCAKCGQCADMIG